MSARGRHEGASVHEKLEIHGWSRLASGLVCMVFAFGLTLASPSGATSAATPTTPTASKKAPPASARLDINVATKAQLADLPGIGDVYSQKIVDGRPYKSKAELESRKILPKGVYDKIAPLVIARQK